MFTAHAQRAAAASAADDYLDNAEYEPNDERKMNKKERENTREK